MDIVALFISIFSITLGIPAFVISIIQLNLMKMKVDFVVYPNSKKKTTHEGKDVKMHTRIKCINYSSDFFYILKVDYKHDNEVINLYDYEKEDEKTYAPPREIVYIEELELNITSEALKSTHKGKMIVYTTKRKKPYKIKSFMFKFS